MKPEPEVQHVLKLQEYFGLSYLSKLQVSTFLKFCNCTSTPSHLLVFEQSLK